MKSFIQDSIVWMATKDDIETFPFVGCFLYSSFKVLHENEHVYKYLHIIYGREKAKQVHDINGKSQMTHHFWSDHIP